MKQDDTTHTSRAVAMRHPLRAWRNQWAASIAHAARQLKTPKVSKESWRRWEGGVMPNDQNLIQLAALIGYASGPDLATAIEEWNPDNVAE